MYSKIITEFRVGRIEDKVFIQFDEEDKMVFRVDLSKGQAIHLIGEVLDYLKEL